jgi:hypothetical protein
LVAGLGFEYRNKAVVIAKTTNDSVSNDCSDMNTRKTQWKESFRTEVAGVERPVCQLHDTVFMVTFYQGRAAHLLEVSYMSKHDVNNNDIRQIVESVKATLE